MYPLAAGQDLSLVGAYWQQISIFIASLDLMSVGITSGVWAVPLAIYFGKRWIERRPELERLEVTGKKINILTAATKLMQEFDEAGLNEGLALIARIDQMSSRQNAPLPADDARKLVVDVNRLILNYECRIVTLSGELILLSPEDARWQHIKTHAAVEMLRRFDFLTKVGSRPNETLDTAMIETLRSFDLDLLRQAIESVRSPFMDAFKDEPTAQKLFAEVIAEDLDFLKTFRFLA